MDKEIKLAIKGAYNAGLINGQRNGYIKALNDVRSEVGKIINDMQDKLNKDENTIFSFMGTYDSLCNKINKLIINESLPNGLYFTEVSSAEPS